MRRNCNLELQLQLPPASSATDSADRRREVGPASGGMRQEEAQMMTIFYDGKVCVTDVTEFQARAILTLASREMECATPAGSPPSRSVCAAGSGGSMSMKRSLQQFLQKRRNRVQATTPYHR